MTEAPRKHLLHSLHPKNTIEKPNKGGRAAKSSQTSSIQIAQTRLGSQLRKLGRDSARSPAGRGAIDGPRSPGHGWPAKGTRAGSRALSASDPSLNVTGTHTFLQTFRLKDFRRFDVVRAMNNRRETHAAQGPPAPQAADTGVTQDVTQEQMRSPYFLFGKSSTKLSVSEGEALAFQHRRGLAVGVRKRGGARRGRGVFPAVRVWDQQHGRGWRRAGSGCAARTNRGSERHGALPGGSQGAPGRARPCSQPGSGAGAAPAARGGAWTPPRHTETSPGAARPRCSPGRTRSAAPNTAGPPRSHAGPAARGSAASPAGPGSLPTRGPLRSAPLPSSAPRPGPTAARRPKVSKCESRNFTGAELGWDGGGRPGCARPRRFVPSRGGNGLFRRLPARPGRSSRHRPPRRPRALPAPPARR